MNRSSSKKCFVFKIVIIIFAVFFAARPSYVINAESPEIPAAKPISSISSTLTDDEINGFLFRIDEDIKKDVLALDSEYVERLPIPILFGISVGDFTDNWGEARPGGRAHEGVDIIASRGELVVSPTDAVITKIGYDKQGGNFVISANPGGEQFYFAHLDRVAENLSVGSILKTGGLIGYVGDTGNARGKSSHLHFGIYRKRVAYNPFPRLSREFSTEEKIGALEQIMAASEIAPGANNGSVRFLQRFLINKNAGANAVALAKTGATGYFGMLTKNALAEYQKASDIDPASGFFGPATKTNILAALNQNGASTEQMAKTPTEIIPESDVTYSLVMRINNDLEVGSSGKEVVWLQYFLISADSGPRARALANTGATGYFGALTENVLIEYQLALGISPASGYFGPITRSSIQTLSGN